MKKIFLFAAAAMVSLSSCVQTEDVYTGGLNEISIKSAVVRDIVQQQADLQGYAISVSSVWDNPTDDKGEKYAPYFEGAKFAHNGTVWAGVKPYYWPTAGNMQFIAVCPDFETVAGSSLVENYGTNGTFATVVYQNIENNLAEQHDILYSDLLAVSAPQKSAQPLQFHHAMAQLNVTFVKVDTAAEVVLNKVTVVDAGLEGDLTITPTVGATSTIAWSDVQTYNRYFLKDTNDIGNDVLNATLTKDTAYSPKALLVIPSDQTSFVVEYTIDGVAQKTIIPLRSAGTEEWIAGHNYTYKFTISVNEIQFKCTVDEWIPVEAGSTTI